LCLNVVSLLSHSIFFPSFPTPLKKMLLASCHGLSGSFSAFLLGESPPYSSRNGENSLPLNSFLQTPVRISVPFTRREACGPERLIASLPPSPPLGFSLLSHTRNMAYIYCNICRIPQNGQNIVFVLLVSFRTRC